MAVLVFLIIFGGIAITVALDVWSTKNDRNLFGTNETESEQTTGENESETESELTINGSTTFQQALDTGITPQQIESIIGDTMPSASQSIKDYCTENGLQFSTIKDRMNQLAE